MQTKKLLLFAVLFTALAIVGRLIEHPWNFTPIGALMLFSGFMLPRRFLWIPLTSLVATDVIIGTYQWQIMLVVYGSYALTVAAAYTYRSSYGFMKAIGSSVGAAVGFFLITNAAVWLWSGMYGAGASGLLASYVAAVPFFRNSLAGYTLFSAVFFGIYEIVRVPLSMRARAAARS